MAVVKAAGMVSFTSPASQGKAVSQRPSLSKCPAPTCHCGNGKCGLVYRDTASCHVS